mgnify:FL=1
MRKELLLSAALGMGFLAVPTISNAQQLASRVSNATKAPTSQRITTPTAKAQGALRAEALNPADYGQVVEILGEDFSLMTTGSVGNPDKDTELWYVREDGNAWMTMRDGYTHQSGWGGGYIYPAGGTVAIANPDEPGHLNTCMMDLSGNDQIAFVQFDMRTDDGQPDQTVIVEGAETFNMAPSWRVLGGSQIDGISSEWKTYTLMFQNAGAYSMFNIFHPQMTQGEVLGNIYVDNFRVYQVNPYVKMPTLYGHSYYTGESFNVSWSKVENADHYLLNVYWVDETNGNAKMYAAENQVVNDTTFTVNGIISGKNYYYVVQSVDAAGHKSFEPTPKLICDLEAPKDLTATDINQDNGTFTASWEAAPSAERYNYWAYCDRKATQDGPMRLTDEDFTGVKCPDGTLGEGWGYSMTEAEWKETSVTNPSYFSMDNYVIQPINQGGWVAKNGFPLADGCIKVDGYQYVYNNSDAGLISPELDLSKNGGKITINVDLWGDTETLQYEDGSKVDYTAQCAVALFNWDPAKNDFTQAELIYVKDLNSSWQNRTIELTKGTDRSVIGLYCVGAPANLFFDNLKIDQDYKAGETFVDPIVYHRWWEGTSVDVQIPIRGNLGNITHRVTAIKSNPETGAIVESLPSDTEFVGRYESTDVKSVNLLSKANVRVEGQTIVVNGNGLVQVYTLDGALVAKAEANGQARITVPSGAYIVKTNNESVKVVF